MNDLIIANCFIIFATSAAAEYASWQGEGNAPYPPSGWRPSGPAFRYSQPLPQDAYGPPAEATTTEAAETTTTESPEGFISIPGEGRNQKLEENEDSAQDGENGVYYIYHPSGVLQKVVYATKDDQERMEFSARLRYENVSPISGPIYTYDPETLVFQKVN